MTTLDGYPLARKGLAGPALGVSAVSSFVGATIAIIGLTLFAPLLAEVAVMFGPAEFFALMVFAFASMSVMMGKDPVKTGIAATLGVLLAMVGVDSGTGVMRYTFDLPELYDGIDFVVMIIGLFAISEDSAHAGTGPWAGSRERHAAGGSGDGEHEGAAVLQVDHAAQWRDRFYRRGSAGYRRFRGGCGYLHHRETSVRHAQHLRYRGHARLGGRRRRATTLLPPARSCLC